LAGNLFFTESSSPFSSRLLYNIAMKEGSDTPASAVVFSSALAQRLTRHRFAPTFVGLDRIVRLHDGPSPATKGGVTAVTAAATDTASAPTHPTSFVVYKVINEDGTERRMTHVEKKQAKLQAAQLKKKLRKEEKQQQQQQAKQKDQINESLTGKNYYQLPTATDPAKPEDVDDRQSHRKGDELPVILSPACTRQAIRQGFLAAATIGNSSCKTVDDSRVVVFDEELSNQWALQVKANMAEAERIRQGEDTRPMPYQLSPEAWTRMRPEFIDSTARDKPSSDLVSSEANVQESVSLLQLQPPNKTERLSNYNETANSIIQLLYQTGDTSSLHISCGAKFGSDYLLYHGPRDQCHAFAGLRIEYCRRATKTNSHEADAAQLPLPTAYDLSGYVRGLNTAGKLALLATVVVDGNLHRVGIVDLALEKIASGPMRQNKRAGPDLYRLQKKKDQQSA
jgi:hypothetical protein